MFPFKNIVFLISPLILISSLLASGQLEFQTHNLAVLQRLRIANKYSSFDPYSTDGLDTAKGLSHDVIPSRVEKFLNDFYESEANGTLDLLQEGMFVGVSNDDCKGHMLEWIRRFPSRWATDKDQWAAQMIDAWSKIPEGILTGHFSSLGDFDECVQVEARNIDILNTKFPNISTDFEGSYCTTSLADYGTAMIMAGRNPNGSVINDEEKINTLLENNKGPAIGERGVMLMMLGVTTATCMPSSCSQRDVQNIFVNVFNRIYSRLGENASLTQPWPNVMNCSVRKKPDMDAAVIIVLILLAALIALSVGAGVVDWWLNHGVKRDTPVERGTVFKYFMAFSFYSNTKKWLSTRRSPDDLGCLHGIRTLSTGWVVLGHTYSVFMSGPQWNILEFMNVWESWTVMAVINGTFSVDTFFVMSGMLATYNILKLLDKTQGKLNLPMFYIHRILRLTPTYAILVGLAATLMTYMGSGPLWYAMDRPEELCRKNWWINLLYINNIYKSNEPCNGESWFLANDMQFYILTPFIVYPIWKWRKIGLPLLALYTVLSCISPVLVVHYEETVPALLPLVPVADLFNYMEKVYYVPWTRIQTFLVGVWLGWILHITKGKRLKLPIWAVAGGWLTSAALALTVIFAIQPWFEPGYEVPKTAGLFYAGLSRFSYGVAVAWVIFACVKGYGGIVNSFLSWKVFMPLGRICFCVYLLSYHLQQIFHWGLTVPIKFSTYNMINIYFAHMVMSYLVGFVATMLFESPFMVLQKLIFDGK